MSSGSVRACGVIIALAVLLLTPGCATSGPSNRPNEREWGALAREHEWLETLRKSTPPPADASRQQQIAAALDAQKKVGPAYDAFMEKLRQYHDRTGDLRAARLLANERILLGDQYMYVLARFDRAINLYQSALAIDPANTAARQRLEEAQKKRFVAMDVFSTVRVGMREAEVQQQLGVPREDWIKQVVQKGKIYTVWIYPKQDGSASAIYFENGVVYHTNWNAAPARTD